MKTVIDMTGQTYGRLTVLARAESRRGKTTWLCRCSCSTETVIRAADLRSRSTVSCGCWRKDRDAERSQNARSHSPEYLAWLNMKTRCANPNDKRFANYGGRGIAVCAEWRNNFTAFFQHVGPRPGPEYSLDRIDNDGNYEPGNVRWATSSEQALNRRPARRAA